MRRGFGARGFEGTRRRRPGRRRRAGQGRVLGRFIRRSVSQCRYTGILLMTRPLPLAVLACAASLAVGCAAATNYLDPAGPIFTGSSERRPLASTGIRVVTFNIKWAKHIDRAIALLSQPGPLARPDVLVLQEMDAPGTKRIAEALGLNWIYIPSAVHPVAHHDFGVAILSPWPLDEARKVPLPHQHRFRKLRRAAASATMQLPVRRGACVFTAPREPRRSRRHGSPRPGPRHQRRRAELARAGHRRGRFQRARRSAGGLGDGVHVGQPARDEHGGLVRLRISVLTRGLCLFGERMAGSVRTPCARANHEPVWVLLRPCGA